jgi:hypothetical protein
VRRFHEDSAAVLNGSVPFDRESALKNQQTMDEFVRHLKATVEEIKSPKSLSSAR